MNAQQRKQERNRFFPEMNLKRGRKALALLAAAVMIGWAPIAGSVSSVQAQELGQAAQVLVIIQQPFVLDGKNVKFPAANVDDSTYIGLRSLNEQLGLNSEWDGVKHMVTVTGRGRVLSLDLIQHTTTLNDQVIYGLPAIVQNGSTFVPLRFLLEHLGYSLSYDVKTHVIGIDTIQENQLTVQTKKITTAGDQKSLLVNYPQIAGFANQDIQLKINTFLQKEAEGQATSGQSQIDVAAAGNKEAEKANPDYTIPPVSFESNYTVTYNEQNRLSLYEDYYIYTGGAHGGTARFSYTFDLLTGNVLTLQDVTAGNANYVSLINAAITSQIQGKGLTLLQPFKSIEPDRAFFLQNQSVVIYFGQYEYTPYSEGMPEFNIPFTAFAGN